MTIMAGEGTAFLEGVRVIELADELGEYCGKVLAGFGAEVIKVEPMGGEATRSIGPFLDDVPHPNRSLHFWHYNHGKRGVTLDLDTSGGIEALRGLLRSADILIDTRPRGFLGERGLSLETIRALHPGLIHLRITPFGDDGPYADYRGSDLVHLALGGVMMNCGYDPRPDGSYDTPPIAPQMWQAYQIAGEHAAIQALVALNARCNGAPGQDISLSVHEAVSTNTEVDVPDWVYLGADHRRRTCAHSFIPASNSGTALVPNIARTKDGRWLYPYRTYLPGMAQPFDYTLTMLRKYGAEEDLGDPKYQDFDYLRGTFVDVDYPELGRRFIQIGWRWHCTDVPWPTLARAPLVGEHNADLLTDLPDRPAPAPVAPDARPPVTSPYGKPFALARVRVLDLSWLLASGGAGRFFTAHGADVIKVEHSSRPDGYRMGSAQIPGGPDGSLNRSGAFMEINSGKRSLSLNLKAPEARAILERLVAEADIVIEGFSPGTMDRMGLGYGRLREINPRIIYVQQSGMGQHGTYGNLRSYGPTAAAFAGLSEMSGLPTPYAPAGIGYSYLDWFGAYQMANAMLAALYRRNRTGKGCWIDSSQVEAGIYLSGTTVLDHSANGRTWQRYGNRSPYKPAAPHGAYPTASEDRWIAISAFSADDWRRLATILGHPEWLSDGDFLTLDGRLRDQDRLDALVAEATRGWDGFALMHALQGAGVAAGVCQSAEDRVQKDPQLRHLGWLVDLDQSEIGRWPVKELPGRLSETPSHIGGRIGRSGPSYGEDSEAILSHWRAMPSEEIAGLRERAVI